MVSQLLAQSFSCVITPDTTLLGLFAATPLPHTHDHTTHLSSDCCAAVETSWHKKCFTCKKCGKEIANTKYYEHEKKAYCDRCILVVNPQNSVKGKVRSIPSIVLLICTCSVDLTASDKGHGLRLLQVAALPAYYAYSCEGNEIDSNMYVTQADA